MWNCKLPSEEIYNLTLFFQFQQLCWCRNCPCRYEDPANCPLFIINFSKQSMFMYICNHYFSRQSVWVISMYDISSLLRHVSLTSIERWHRVKFDKLYQNSKLRITINLLIVKKKKFSMSNDLTHNLSIPTHRKEVRHIWLSPISMKWQSFHQWSNKVKPLDNYAREVVIFLVFLKGKSMIGQSDLTNSGHNLQLLFGGQTD